MQDPVLLILASAAGPVFNTGPARMDQAPERPGSAARVARTALATGHRVLAALPSGRPALRAAFGGGRIGIVEAQGPDLLAAGLRALPPAAPVMVLRSDQAELLVEDLLQMLSAWRATPGLILRATDEDGAPGHPLCLPDWAREVVAETDDLTPLMRRHAGRMRMFPLDGDRATARQPPARATDSLDGPGGRVRAALAARRAAIMRPAGPAPRNV